MNSGTLFWVVVDCCGWLHSITKRFYHNTNHINQ